MSFSEVFNVKLSARVVSNEIVAMVVKTIRRPLNQDAYPGSLMSMYPQRPRPATIVRLAAGNDGINKAGQAINEGVTDQVNCFQDGEIPEEGVANLPHLTPPKKDNITAP